MVASKGKGTSLYYIIGVYFKCVLKPVILFDIKKMPLFFGSTTFFSRAKIVNFFFVRYLGLVLLGVGDGGV